eukprot:gene16666-19805_t
MAVSGDYFQYDRCSSSICSVYTLNAGKTTKIVSNITHPYGAYIGQDLFDENWFIKKLCKGRQPDNSIVQGSIEGKDLVSTRTFISLQNQPDYCAPIALPWCDDGFMATYTRDVKGSRCIIFDQCRPTSECNQAFVPTCPPGYSLFGGPFVDNALPTYSCDPAFMSEPRNHEALIN